MRVLINAFSARQGGGQTYLLNLLDCLPCGSDPEIIVLAPESLNLLDARSNINRLRINWPVENPILRFFWEKIQLPRLLHELGVDILFCPGGIIGSRAVPGCQTVTMFRNMLPFDLIQRRKYPPGYMRMRNWILHRLMLQSMLRADLVIFISEYARSIIETIADGPLKKALVIPHGINPRFRITDGGKGARPEWLPKEEYLLYVSRIDVYKAQLEVVRGFAQLKEQRQTKEKLILVGTENPQYGRKVRAEINRSGLGDEVVMVGSVRHEELPAVYHHAKVNIFASESENCPNILLEALAAGRPIVASNRPPMPEFGGDAVIYFDPATPDDLAEKLARIVHDPDRMKELSTSAMERSFQFDAARVAEQTWRAIAKLHQGGCQSAR